MRRRLAGRRKPELANAPQSVDGLLRDNPRSRAHVAVPRLPEGGP